MSAPNVYQLDVLSQASEHLAADDFAPYLQLRRLLRDESAESREEFRSTFESYYGLKAGGVTDAFRDRYFEILYGLELQEGTDPYTPILKDLYQIPRHKGDRALAASFVSKLVAIHDETRPLLDRHVSGFFGICVPQNGGIDFRIAGLVSNLGWLGQIYRDWSQSDQVLDIIAKLLGRHPSLEACAIPRLADFLVWTVGRKKLVCRPPRGPDAKVSDMTAISRVERSRRPTACPACGSKRVARIMYGYPAYSDELQAQLDAGTVVLGGCVITGDDPAWRCTQCGQRIYRKKA